MGKNIKTLFKNSTKERFSLRKLNIGVCSVVLGLTFVGVTTQKAYADTIAGVQEAKQVKSQSSIISSVSSKNERVELDQNQENQQSDEKAWRLPIAKEYFDKLKSNSADFKNSVGKPGAGASVAANFLAAFVNDDVKWIHLDIAGTADNDGTGATGAMIRSVVNFIAAN